MYGAPSDQWAATGSQQQPQQYYPAQDLNGFAHAPYTQPNYTQTQDVHNWAQPSSQQSLPQQPAQVLVPENYSDVGPLPWEGKHNLPSPVIASQENIISEKSKQLDGLSSPTGIKMEVKVSNLSYTVEMPQKKGEKQPETKVILKDINLTIGAGRFTVLMGASGAGKTSLMSVISGDTSAGTVYGSVSINGAVVDASKLKKMSAYVFQDDVILGTMTVREAITMSARLRLPASMPDAEKLRKVEEVIRILHLTDCADAVIGTETVKGVSGGERKRCSVGMELVTDPPLLFLDEPTSGLDTFTALSLTSTLKQLAQSGRTVVSTMHQPSSEIFHLFDDLILLGRGEVLYAGPAEDSVQYFSSIGYPCPRYTNPADYFFVSVINDESGKVSRDIRNSELAGAWAKHAATQKSQMMLAANGASAEEFMSHKSEKLGGFATQFHLLYQRSAKNMVRNKLILRARLGQTIFLSVIVGLVYQRLGDDLPSIQDRQGFLFFLCVNSVMGYAMGSLSTFTEEKIVFVREYRSQMYSLPAYFTAKVSTEIPVLILFPFIFSCILYWMVGLQENAAKFFISYLAIFFLSATGQGIGTFVASMFADPHVGLQVLPIFLMPLMLFSGFMINNDSIPVYFNWIKYLSPMKYGMVAICKNEFFGLEFTCSSPPCPTGTDVLEQLGFIHELNIVDNIVVLGALFIGLNIMGFLALWRAGTHRATTKYIPSAMTPLPAANPAV